MPRYSGRERGSTILEFLIGGISILFLLLIICEACLAMWSYHTLATAIEDGALYASTKGQGCAYSGNNCRVHISDIVQDILTAGTGIDASQLNLTFHSSAAGYADISCNPASTCLSGGYTTTLWPPAKVSSGPPAVYGDLPGISYIDITGTYPSPVPVISLFVPARLLPSIGTLQFSATSRQVIQF